MKIYVNGTIMPNKEVPVFLKGDKGDSGGYFPQAIQIVPSSFQPPMGWINIGNLNIGGVVYNCISQSYIENVIRTATPDTTNLLFAGNENMLNIFEQFENNWSGIIDADFEAGATIKNIWDRNDLLVNDTNWRVLLTTTRDESLSDLITNPYTTSRIAENLQYFYWAGLKAKENGGELVLIIPWDNNSANGLLNDKTNSYYSYIRKWLQDHLLVNVFMVPANEYVSRLVAAIGASNVFEGSSNVVRENVIRGIGYLTQSFLTKERVDNVQVGDEQLDNIAWQILQEYKWAGFGGEQEYTISHTVDLLPNPETIPDDDIDEGLPLGLTIRWDANRYDGPFLEGTQPITINNVLRFQGNGLLLDRRMNGYYICTRVKRVLPAGEGGYSLYLTALSDSTNPWDSNAYATISMHTSELFQNVIQGATHQYISSHHRSFDEWVTLEAWVFGYEIGIRFGSEAERVLTTEVTPDTKQNAILFLKDNNEVQSEFDVAGFILMERMPTVEERSQIRSWLLQKTLIT